MSKSYGLVPFKTQIMTNIITAPRINWSDIETSDWDTTIGFGGA